VETAKPGRHMDGDGLMLVVQSTGGRSWIVRVQHEKRRRDIGLGGFPIIGLARARELALETRRAIREGRDPIAERQQHLAVPTLAEALHVWIAKEAPDWRGGLEGHTARVTPRLFDLHLAGLMSRRVSEINEKAVTLALMGVWHQRRETAKKLFDRLRGTMHLAKANGHCPKMDWDEVRAALPSGKIKAVHHPALKLDLLPEFARWLVGKDTAAARALLFIILTATRSGEARGAQWSEMRLKEQLWTISGDRTKTKVKYEIPLSEAAMGLLDRALTERDLLRPGNPTCFPGPTTGRPLSDVAVSKLLREAGHSDSTVHGFRSCFRVWAADVAYVQREIAEACLAHAPEGGPVEAAYRRTTMLTQRRVVMESWAAFVLKNSS